MHLLILYQLVQALRLLRFKLQGLPVVVAVQLAEVVVEASTIGILAEVVVPA
jgi:hypothetical protein